MPDEPKKIPLQVLSMLREAQLRVQLAEEQFRHLVTKIEGRLGVRLQNAQIADDGTVIEAQPPESSG